MQEKMMFNLRAISVSTVLNYSFVWKLRVYRIVDLHINLCIYFYMIIDSKNIMKPYSF